MKNEEMAQLRQEGLTFKQIGELAGCTKQNVQSRLKAFEEGVLSRRQKEKYDSVVLYTMGWSIKDLALRYNITVGAMRIRLRSKLKW